MNDTSTPNTTPDSDPVITITQDSKTYFDFTHTIDLNIVIGNVDYRYTLDLQPDITPLESFKLNYMLNYSSLHARSGGTYIGQPDYIKYINDHKLLRHFHVEKL